MNILELAKESKRRTNLSYGISIDWQYAQQLIQSISKATNNSNEYSNEFIMQAKALTELLTNIEEAVIELKAIVPKFEDQ